MATNLFGGNFPFNTYHETSILESRNVVQRLGNVFTLRHSKLHAADLLNRIDNFQFASQATDYQILFVALGNMEFAKFQHFLNRKCIPKTNVGNF